MAVDRAKVGSAELNARRGSAIRVRLPVGRRFVAVEHHGRWGEAEYLIVGGRFSDANSVSCGPAGNCAAGGDYSDDTGGIVQGAVVVGEHGGWGGQTDVPGLKALNKGEDAAVTTVSCPPAGRCVAGGYYLDRHGHFQAFVTYKNSPRPRRACGSSGRCGRSGW